MAVAFDTFAFHERLRAGGFTDQQAKAATEAFAHATAQQLATKADLEALGVELRAEIRRVETELTAEIRRVQTELRAEIAGVEQRLAAKITESQNTFIKWLVPLMIGQTALLATLVRLL